MKNSKILVVLAVPFLSVTLSSVAVGQDKATPQEVVAKVREAASTLSKTGDVAQFNKKQAPWVWKDTYIFVGRTSSRKAFAMQRRRILPASGASIGGRSPARRRAPASSAIA